MAQANEGRQSRETVQNNQSSGSNAKAAGVIRIGIVPIKQDGSRHFSRRLARFLD